jgi:hypothetical protein
MRYQTSRPFSGELSESHKDHLAHKPDASIGVHLVASLSQTRDTQFRGFSLLIQMGTSISETIRG